MPQLPSLAIMLIGCAYRKGAGQGRERELDLPPPLRLGAEEERELGARGAEYEREEDTPELEIARGGAEERELGARGAE